jgi:hypothetical protein
VPLLDPGQSVALGQVEPGIPGAELHAQEAS